MEEVEEGVREREREREREWGGGRYRQKHSQVLIELFQREHLSEDLKFSEGEDEVEQM